MRLSSWALGAALSAFLTILVGAYVVKTDAGLSCEPGTWPLCNGSALPPFRQPSGFPADYFDQSQIISEWFHRLVAGITGIFTIGVFFVARKERQRADLWTLAILASGLLFAQILMGAATVQLGNAPWTVVIHQGLAMSYFGVLVALIALSWRPRPTGAPPVEAAAAASPTPSAETPRGLLEVVGDYVSLTKPRVLILLLVSAVTSMLIAVGPEIRPGVVLATVLGGALASASGSAFNQWWERDLDAMMTRTASRPVAAGRLRGSHVLAFSAVCGLGSFMVLATFVNLLAACLALAGAVFYVVVYTLWLKRITPQNIVIGGAAGSFPALVGWAAATGSVHWPALVLGLVVFLWTPPHFWSLALVYKADYARASVPMLPVVRGEWETRQQIFLYSVALLLCGTSLWFFGVVSDTWLIFSMALGLVLTLACSS